MEPLAHYKKQGPALAYFRSPSVGPAEEGECRIRLHTLPKRSRRPASLHAPLWLLCSAVFLVSLAVLMVTLAFVDAFAPEWGPPERPDPRSTTKLPHSSAAPSSSPQAANRSTLAPVAATTSRHINGTHHLEPGRSSTASPSGTMIFSSPTPTAPINITGNMTGSSASLTSMTSTHSMASTASLSLSPSNGSEAGFGASAPQEAPSETGEAQGPTAVVAPRNRSDSWRITERFVVFY